MTKIDEAKTPYHSPLRPGGTDSEGEPLDDLALAETQTEEVLNSHRIDENDRDEVNTSWVSGKNAQ